MALLSHGTWEVKTGSEVVISIMLPRKAWAALTDVEHWPDWRASMTSVTRVDSGSFGVVSQARTKQPELGK